MKATWCRLTEENGEWGIRVEAQQEALLTCIEGQEVEVVTRAGQRSVQRVTKVLGRWRPSAKKAARGALPYAICKIEKLHDPKYEARKARARARAQSERQLTELHDETQGRGPVRRVVTDEYVDLTMKLSEREWRRQEREAEARWMRGES